MSVSAGLGAHAWRWSRGVSWMGQRADLVILNAKRPLSQSLFGDPRPKMLWFECKKFQAEGAQCMKRVVARLRHKLVEGEIPPGARVPERELCEALGISRTPLREALKVAGSRRSRRAAAQPRRGARREANARKRAGPVRGVRRAWRRSPASSPASAFPTSRSAEIAALHAAMLTHFSCGAS